MDNDTLKKLGVDFAEAIDTINAGLSSLHENQNRDISHIRVEITLHREKIKKIDEYHEAVKSSLVELLSTVTRFIDATVATLGDTFAGLRADELGVIEHLEERIDKMTLPMPKLVAPPVMATELKGAASLGDPRPGDFGEAKETAA